MSLEKVKNYLETVDLGGRVHELSQTTATVEDAASAIGCRPEHIAKTMSFLLDEEPILIVTAGDAKIDNRKYKSCFHKKAKMIPWELVEQYTGHAPGGVCPFAVNPSVKVYLDISLKRFQTVYPAGGSGNSAVELSIEELDSCSNSSGWVDVCSNWIAEG